MPGNPVTYFREKYPIAVGGPVERNIVRSARDAQSVDTFTVSRFGQVKSRC